MKKAILPLLLAALLCLPIAAWAEGAWLDDQAGLLSTAQTNAIETRIEALYEQYQMAFGVVTTDDFGGKTPEAYADDYFDYEEMGYGSSRDGMVFVVNMDSRDMYLSTHGKGISALNDAAIANILAACGAHLKNGDVAAAITTYLDLAVSYTQDYLRAPNSPSYDSDVHYSEESPWVDAFVFALPISLLVTLIVLIVMLVMHRRSLPMAPSGSVYISDKGAQYTHEADVFLHTNTTRTARPKNDTNDSGDSQNSTHTSSSGETHGGGGAKF